VLELVNAVMGISNINERRPGTTRRQMREGMVAVLLAAAVVISAGTGRVMGRNVTTHVCYRNSNCRVTG
jgi:hypothetical protein